MAGHDVGNPVVSLMGDEDIEVGGGDSGIGDGLGGALGDVSHSPLEDRATFHANEGVNLVGISASRRPVLELDSFELIRARSPHHRADPRLIAGTDDCGTSPVREEEGGGAVVKIRHFRELLDADNEDVIRRSGADH